MTEDQRVIEGKFNAEQFCLFLASNSNIPSQKFINVSAVIDSPAAEELVGFICRLASTATEIIEDLPLMRAGVQTEVVLDRLSISHVLATIFVCSHKTVNITVWWTSDHPVMLEKLKCLLNYFQRILKTPPTGSLSIKRSVLRSPVDWRNVTAVIHDHTEILKEGKIEDSPSDYAKIDFANKYIGGGVFRHGCVQEEIFFVIYPELLATILITDPIEDNEVIVISGVERFSDYEGYASRFKFAGNIDSAHFNPRNEQGNIETTFIALDAFYFNASKNYTHLLFKQFSPTLISRELNKLYCGFRRTGETPQNIKIATGNWGCGAFNGDIQLKSILQLLAYSLASADYPTRTHVLRYYTFGDPRCASRSNAGIDIEYIYRLLSGMKIQQVLKLLEKYREDILKVSISQKQECKVDLYGFLANEIQIIQD